MGRDYEHCLELQKRLDDPEDVSLCQNNYPFSYRFGTFYSFSNLLKYLGGL